MRMRHIEKALGIHAVNYLRYLDNSTTLDNSGLSAEDAAEIATRRVERRIGLPVHPRLGVQDVLTFLPIVTLVVWALYVWWLICRA
jgi:hypothetical protein